MGALFVGLGLLPAGVPAVGADPLPTAALLLDGESNGATSEGRAVPAGVDEELDSLQAQAETIASGEPALPGMTSANRNRIEEIVVRARKREEALEDTPVSITALGAAALVEHGVTRLDDIEQMVPNLTFQQTFGGQDALARIRGVGTPRAGIQFDPGVGIYVDGVFLARSPGGLIDLLDVQQIEVLRGPQGTLFGKNTVGGALNISTVRPHEELETSASIRVGNFASVNARAMLNIPILEDRLFSRVSISTDQSEGYVFNETRDEYLSNQNSLNFVGSLRYLPLENLTLDVVGSWSRNRTRGMGGRCVYVQETGLQGLVPGWPEACRKSEPFQIESNVAQVADVESYGAWGTASLDLGTWGFVEDLSLKSITSWREQRPQLRSDSDGTAYAVIRLAEMGGGPLQGSPGFAQQISQEVQVNAAALDGRLVYVGGYFTYWEKANYSRTLSAFPGILNTFTHNDIETDNSNWALYSQVSFAATEWLNLTAGLRYTDETKGLAAINQAINPETGEGIPPPTLSGDSTQTFSAWTPMASIALEMPESILEGTGLNHVMGYFTYAGGFRGGGFNALGRGDGSTELEPFAPEYIDSYEIGAKTIALDQRLIVNLSLFLAKYDDIQVVSIREVGDEDGDGIPDILQLTLNAAKATTQGLELEIQAMPMDGLQLTGSVGFIDARYDDFIGINDLNNDLIDRSGQTFNATPRWQTFLAAQYSWPIELRDNRFLSGWLTPRLEWAYQSEVHYTGPEVVAGRQRGFNLLNARLSYDFWDDQAQVALWGKNLTNEGYFGASTPIANFFGVTIQYYEAPRTFGGEISFHF